MKCVFQTANLTYPFECIAEMNLKLNIIQIDLLIFSSKPPQINTKQINLPNLFLFQITLTNDAIIYPIIQAMGDLETNIKISPFTLLFTFNWSLRLAVSSFKYCLNLSLLPSNWLCNWYLCLHVFFLLIHTSHWQSYIYKMQYDHLH